MDIVCLRNISINTLAKGDDDDDDDDIENKPRFLHLLDAARCVYLIKLNKPKI
jgi:hypothetical protein